MTSSHSATTSSVRFQKDQGNYVQLIAAYQAAGLKVSAGCSRYLKLLGTVTVPDNTQGPLNIWTIAKFRNDGLLMSQL